MSTPRVSERCSTGAAFGDLPATPGGIESIDSLFEERSELEPVLLREAGASKTALHGAGARTAVTSLWKVNDEAARRLMELFYAGMWTEGLGKAEARWPAKRTLREEEGPVREWAAWVLTGDPDRGDGAARVGTPTRTERRATRERRRNGRGGYPGRSPSESAGPIREADADRTTPRLRESTLLTLDHVTATSEMEAEDSAWVRPAPLLSLERHPPHPASRPAHDPTKMKQKTILWTAPILLIGIAWCANGSGAEAAGPGEQEASGSTQELAWSPKDRRSIEGRRLEVRSEVARVQVTAAFNGDRHIQAATRSATGWVHSVQSLRGASWRSPVVDEEIQNFTGSSSAITSGQQTARDESFGDWLDGRAIVHRYDAAGARGYLTTAEGDSVQEADFLGAFPFSSAWLPAEGESVGVGEEWTKRLDPAHVAAFVRLPGSKGAGELTGRVDHFYEEEGDRMVNIELFGLLSFERESRNGNQYTRAHAIVTGRVNYNVTRGFTAGGSFRFVEPIELLGGPQRPLFSMDGFADWRTRFQAELLEDDG